MMPRRSVAVLGMIFVLNAGSPVSAQTADEITAEKCAAQAGEFYAIQAEEISRIKKKKPDAAYPITLQRHHYNARFHTCFARQHSESLDKKFHHAALIGWTAQEWREWTGWRQSPDFRQQHPLDYPGSTYAFVSHDKSVVACSTTTEQMRSITWPWSPGGERKIRTYAPCQHNSHKDFENFVDQFMRD